MFYKLNVAKRLMKRAYKGAGLIVGVTEQGWFYVAGTWWCICQDINLTPKEFKAAVIELVGDLPEPGSNFRAYKDGGNQYMIDQSHQFLLPRVFAEIDDGDAGNDYKETPIILEFSDHTVRVLESEQYGPIMTVQEEAIQLVDRDGIDHDAGETDIIGPAVLGSGDPRLVWHNDDTWFMAYCVAIPKADGEDRELIEGIAGMYGTLVFEPKKNTLWGDDTEDTPKKAAGTDDDDEDGTGDAQDVTEDTAEDAIGAAGDE